jgi:pimeloyl-ACP methyl ester carboxylesterase
MDGEASIESFVQTARSVLDLHASTGPAHIVAHSMGTVVAQHLALAAADRVRSLSLLGPIHAPGDMGRKGLRERAARANGQGLTEIADDIVASGLSLETKAGRPEVAACVREFIMRQSPEGYARHCEALAGARAADRSKIAVPVLLITGDEDNTAPPRAVRSLNLGWPGSTMVVLGRCGHWTTLERPLEVTTRLLDFILATP